MTQGLYWLETLGCPKNQVDSDKIAGTLTEQGYAMAESPEDADLVVVNTCAFIEAAREESIETVLGMAESKAAGARLVVTGCMAERYGEELAVAMPEVDLVAGFGEDLTQVTPQRVAITLRSDTRAEPRLLDAPRLVAEGAPWSYVKVAEGCDRRCGFCAIPSFRGDQRSRSAASIMQEVEGLVASGTKEIVLISQDLASWGLDRRATGLEGALDVLDTAAPEMQPLVHLTNAVADVAERTRLLYLYPSGLTENLIQAVLDTGVPYFDLSLQHVSPTLLRRMRRWGNAEKFLDRIAAIRAVEPSATFRSSFIIGYPGETEADHDALLEFLDAADLDWVGFFSFSNEDGTYAADLGDHVAPELVAERLKEASERQDVITEAKREAMLGQVVRVLVDDIAESRSTKEAPEIDGIIEVPEWLEVGHFYDVTITQSLGTDLVGEPVENHR